MANEVMNVEVEGKEKYYSDLLKQFEKEMVDIPFSLSKFQIKNFMENTEVTPERAYRNLGLQAYEKIKAVKYNIFQLRRMEIDIAELRERIADENTNKYEKMRAEIDIEEKLDGLGYTYKLFKDAEEELKFMMELLSKYPKYTREQFETGEKEFWEIKLSKEALRVVGPIDALMAMGTVKLGENIEGNRLLELMNKAKESNSALELKQQAE